MTILFTFLCSFSASYFFNVIYDAPKKLFFPAGFAGSMGYFVSYILEQSFEMDSIYSSLLGSLTLGLLAHIMSRIFKAPVVLLCFLASFHLSQEASLLERHNNWLL